MPFVRLEEIKEKEIAPGFRARMVHAEHMTVAHWNITQGSSLPEHSHPHEQYSILLEGQFELTVGDETEVLSPGLVAVIPGGITHGGTALTDCRIVDIFHPVREDYR